MSPAIRKRLALVLALVVVVALGLPTTGFAAKGGVAGLGVTGQTAVFVEDMYEPDDDFEDAYVYNPAVDGNTFWSHRTFHGVNNEIDDEYDMIEVTVTSADTPIWVETMRLDGRYDTYITIYDADEVELETFDDNDFFYSTYSDSAYFRVPEPGTYYIEVENISGYPFAYELFITVGNARRVWGDNRYATAAEVSRLQWDNTGNAYYGTGYGPEHIVIAKGTDPADALAGGSLAAQLEGVLLLTDTDYLPIETYEEIERVTESKYWADEDVTVHVLGGTAAVSEDVFEDLQNIRGVTAVYRHFGGDRYETAAEVATAMDDELGVGTTAYIVNGLAWPDAL
ncbi:MAG: cell wall-binding repeat-containing protein, partial [Coriobacteriia bacterium]|nr:cell wall-binding repeat-containing protein [Coriobacteriia bacterium]